MALVKICTLLCFGLALSSAAVLQPEVRSYDSFSVFTVMLNSRNQMPGFSDFVETSGLVADVWQEPKATSHPRKSTTVNYAADVLVAPENVEAFTAAIQKQGWSAAMKIPDVGAIITEQAEQMARTRSANPKLTWSSYYRYAEIMAYVDEIVANNSDIASVQTIGTSTEGRAIKMVKISKPGSAPNKPAILIDGGFHAREWISPAIATFILENTLNNRDQEVLDAVDLYVIPIVNVDGYEYSHTNERLWRKTRSTRPGSSCRGADPNRNFDFYFGGAGTSTSPCSEIYTGPEPFSEPEVAAVRDVILQNGDSINLVSYLTIHSYGQWWLTPWSYTYDLPEDYDDLIRFGNTGADALTAVYGTQYEVGATTEILGPTAGCADDWAKGVAGVKYANTIEVRDTGFYGFLLPESQILPTATETWTGIRAVCLFNFGA